jgi:hypothetical protein
VGKLRQNNVRPSRGERVFSGLSERGPFALGTGLRTLGEIVLVSDQPAKRSGQVRRSEV